MTDTNYISIRKATLSDKEEVLKLVKEFYYDAPKMLGQWKKDYNNFFSDILIAEIGKKSVGYLAAFPNNEPGAIYIGDLYVKPDYRRLGVGTMLVKEVEKEAKKKSRDIRLDVRMKDEPARKLYNKLGFEEVGMKNKTSLKLMKNNKS